MQRFLAFVLASPFLVVAVPPSGWPTGSVRHRFHDTPSGQIHYVLGGDVTHGVPLLLFHSHPRSTVEFRYFIGDLGPKTAFIAIDMFGMGLSEDYKGKDESDKFCTFETFARYALEILAQESVQKFAPIGNLKGCSLAIETAFQAGANRVDHYVLMGPLILSPAAKAFIDTKLIPMLQNQTLQEDGSHLTQAWMDPSAAPMGPDGKPWSNARDLLANQEKTNDELRCMSTGWQYDAAWTAYNEKNEPRVAAVDKYSNSLLIFGTQALADEEKYGLDPEFSDRAFANALTHGRNSSYLVQGGSQGMLIQNSSLIAHVVQDFLQGKTETVTV